MLQCSREYYLCRLGNKLFAKYIGKDVECVELQGTCIKA